MKLVKAYSVRERPLSGFVVSEDSDVSVGGVRLLPGDFVPVNEDGSFGVVVPADTFASEYRVRKARAKKVAGDRESGGE